MESYGKLLKDAREAKNLDLEKVAREISIERRYLEGLEAEESGVFPGEAYMVGFLKNYATYLELDCDFLLKLYHNKQIQEAPLPEGLYGNYRKKSFLPIVIISSIAVACVIIVVSVLLVIKNKKVTDDEVIVSSKSKNKQYELTDQKFIKRVYKGDKFLIPSGSETPVFLTVRNTLSSFGIDTPTGTYYVELAEEAELDINGDNISDMIIYVSDISPTDETRGAEVSILMRQGMSVVAATVSDEDIPLESEIKTTHPQIVILEDNRAYPFTINASFRGPCLFRDKVDRADSVETYFSSGEVFTATPHNGIRLWISNNNAVKFSIIADSRTYDLDIGAAGQVFVEDIKWIRDTDGKYKLVVIELD